MERGKKKKKAQDSSLFFLYLPYPGAFRSGADCGREDLILHCCSSTSAAVPSGLPGKPKAWLFMELQ